MKKILILSLTIILTLTGCGAGATNTMSCTYENTTGAIIAKTKYNVDYEGKEVKKVRITYDYTQNGNGTNGNATNGNTNGTTGNTAGNDMNANGNTNNNKDMDGVGTGTDGTTNDTQIDNDGIVDGIVGNAIDEIISGVADTILDIAGLKQRHATVQDRYGNISGFSTQNTTDTDNNYKVTYVIDFDTISNDDLRTLNLSRDIDTLRDNYTSQGYTCSK